MGTTQRIIPGVSGEPNWGNLNNAVTSIANAVAAEQQIGQEVERVMAKEKEKPTQINTQTLEELNRRQQRLHRRIENNTSSALRNLIKTGGGGASIIKGKSHSLGKAGLAGARRLSSFFIAVHNGGLKQTLKVLGFTTLKGKTLQNVIDFLLIYFSEDSNGMDEIAANMAACQIMEELSEGVNTLTELENKMQSQIADNTLTELICDYYGLYLFEHLSQRFQEKITQMKGEAVSKETFRTIKEDIIAQVHALHNTTPLSNIDWKGKAGKDLEEKLFDSIIKIFE